MYRYTHYIANTDATYVFTAWEPTERAATFFLATVDRSIGHVGLCSSPPARLLPPVPRFRADDGTTHANG